MPKTNKQIKQSREVLLPGNKQWKLQRAKMKYMSFQAEILQRGEMLIEYQKNKNQQFRKLINPMKEIIAQNTVEINRPLQKDKRVFS